ncbi:uncharacterized protein LOC116204537 [Punica granatum]|uniref:Senescence regulator S40 n=2 Tax=Punica granatum TaxID=22663 RepID=A0A218X411_PUNGR|nr:uncharacterized protein LOC116204537 [Punica granatum]OWM79664.1 hypothetical protein CDL15_Pgr023076 [Punica granatum]PKI53893.1 hypothetical protein CRG98_025687 [Punica granatum]
MEGLKLKAAARPPPIRYLGHFKQPESVADPFEFQESDVVWSSDMDPVVSPRTPNSPTIISGNPSLVRQRPAINPALSAVSGARPIPHQSPPGRGVMTGPTRMSAPVNVPVWPKWKEEGPGGRISGEFGDEEGDLGCTQEKIVPPHEIVAQSHATTAFSVFEGAGRTLKGRDLRRVRDAVFRKTGFLD